MRKLNIILKKLSNYFLIIFCFVYFSYPTGITSLAFSHDGGTLAIASSYHYERGQLFQSQPKDDIYIRRVSDLETKPK